MSVIPARGRSNPCQALRIMAWSCPLNVFFLRSRATCRADPPAKLTVQLQPHGDGGSTSDGKEWPQDRGGLLFLLHHQQRCALSGGLAALGCYSSERSLASLSRGRNSSRRLTHVPLCREYVRPWFCLCAAGWPGVLGARDLLVSVSSVVMPPG